MARLIAEWARSGGLAQGGADDGELAGMKLTKA